MYSNLFQALYANLNGIPQLNVGVSGFLKTTDKLPYCSVSNISNTLDNKNSFLGRYEQSYYQLSVFSENHSQLINILDKIEDKYKGYHFNLSSNRTLNYFGFNSRQIRARKKQLFQGIILFEILVENKRLASNPLLKANTLEEAILKRYQNYIPLKVKISPPIESDYEVTNKQYPYFLSDTKFNINFYTSLSRVEQHNLTFDIYCKNLDDLVEIIYAIEDCYDNANIKLADKIFTIFDWQSDRIEEIEPGIWKSTINYNINLEKIT